MQIVVVSSPGAGREPHWSQAVAAELAAEAAQRGAAVRWLAAVHEGESTPTAGDGVQVSTFCERRALPLSKVAKSQVDAPLELALTALLRAEPSRVVVHVGLGGQGSPNVLWLADRLGSRTFACARGAELVCHRGDLIDRDREPCRDWSDAERCRWCCATSWWSKPRANDLRNRVDLFVAGLHTCETITVPSEDDIPFVTDLGIAPARLNIGTPSLLAHLFR